MKLPERTRHYVSPLFDSARWDSVALRPGDVIVATPYKAGTTWTQFLCMSAIHGTPELPAGLSALSPWADGKLYDLENVRTSLEAQQWRRVIKTHTPFDGVPYREDVSYVVTARDPRDAFLSMRDHNANFKEERRAEVLRAAGIPENIKLPEDVDVLFRMWMTMPSHPWTHDGFPFGPYFHHLTSFWEFRDVPNVHLMHYRELRANLPRMFDGLAAFLGVTLSAEQRQAILSAARFETMRDSAEKLAPLAEQDVWHDSRQFFRSARSEAWRDDLSAESQALYQQLTRERYPRDFLNWIENGER